MRTNTPVPSVQVDACFLDQEGFRHAIHLSWLPPAKLQPDPMQPRKPMDPETLVIPLGTIQNGINDMDFPSLFAEEGEMSTETLTSLKNIMDEAFTRALKMSRVPARKLSKCRQYVIYINQLSHFSD